MTLEQWQRGWDALVLEAKLRGSFVGLSTNNLAVPRDLWDRMVAYPPKPTSLPKDEPRSDEDGHCTRCGCPFEDPRELTHECPPGFIDAPPKDE